MINGKIRSVPLNILSSVQFVEDHTHPGITFSDGSVVVDSFLIVAPIVGFCNVLCFVVRYNLLRITSIWV